MPKIFFVEPKATQAHIFAQFKLPRLGLVILGTLMKKRGWDVEVIIEDLTPINIDHLCQADIVGISAITNTAEKAYILADALKNKGIVTVMGGPHVTFMPDEALNHTDFVIRGEGEIPFMKFIDAWENIRDYSGVPGLSYKCNNTAIHNPQSKTVPVLDELPVPDLSLVNNNQSLRILPVQTSRGCPYDCSFCSVTGMFGRKYRYRSTEHIMAELRGYRGMNKMVFFYDDHFAADRSRAKELLRAMIDEGLNFKWSTQVRTEISRDDELLDMMKMAGCHTLFIGIESASPESLTEMNKKQTTGDIISAARAIHERGIHVHGMFVYGFDSDTPSLVRDTVRFAHNLGITSAQFLVLTPYPGTRIRKELESRITAAPWSQYDTHHVVFRPYHFSMIGLQFAQIRSHRMFYSIGRMIKLAFRKNWLALGIALFARYINLLYIIKNTGYIHGLLAEEKSVSHFHAEKQILIEEIVEDMT